MKTIGQLADLTNISVRTLQYYDEIGLLKPACVTAAGYRYYDDESIERLQQILFFKELDFKLKDIQKLLEQPDFDKQKAYAQQKELLSIKRDRLNELIKLLERLEKGEHCMSFKEFDLSDYIAALEHFKAAQPEEIAKHWGSVETFDEFIQKVKDHEENVAKIAIQQFGSIEKYTEAMKDNMEHFSEIMEQYRIVGENQEELLKESEELYHRLTKDLSKNPASPEIQAIVGEIITFSKKMTPIDMGEGYWDMVIETYSDATIIEMTDRRYGNGASTFIAKALQFHFHS